MSQDSPRVCSPPDVSDQDILQAMSELRGYLDITPADFKELYRVAYCLAVERLASSRTAREIMTQDVAWVELDTPLPRVAQLMAQRGVSGVPVLDAERKVAGVISNQDFLRLMGGGQAHNLMALAAQCLNAEGCLVSQLRGRLAQEIMSAPAVAVEPEASLAAMARLMGERKVNRLPVVDPEGRLLGIVSRADLLRASGGA